MALLIRLPSIDKHPPGLWYDEAINGLDALSIIHRNPVQIFFTTEHHPREPLYMYLVAFLFLFAKPTVFSLRAVSAIMGAACIPAVYGFVRAATKNRRLALASALILLTMRWDIHHSRLALRAILIPLWLTIAFWAIVSAIESRQRNRFLLAGIIFGLGFYTHLLFRFAPFILVGFAILLFWQKRLNWRRDRGNVFLFCAAAFIVFLPLGIDYVLHPFHFVGRAQEVSLFVGGFLPGTFAILKNIVATVLMFSFRGDENPLLNLPGASVFTPLASIFFYIGIYICARRLKRDGFSFLILLWFMVMLFGTILSTGTPHFSRSLGACVPAAILVAIGLMKTFELFVDFLRMRRALILISILWLTMSAWDTYLYFGKYRGDARLWHRSNAAWVEVARAAASFCEGNVYIYLPGDIYRHPSVRFITLNVEPEKLRPMAFPEALSGRRGEVPRNHIILATIYNRLDVLLKKEIPSGAVIQIFRAPEGNAWSLFYRIPKSALLSAERAKTHLKFNSPETER